MPAVRDAMDPKQAKSIFLHAVEQIPPIQWADYLAGACGDDAGLRHGVELLLSAHRENVDLADQARQACNDVLPTIDQPVQEKPGTQIGPYKLIEQIGEGGMGTVWMAQQIEPVKRLVAVKVIKPGMDSRQVIARFEAERQALALMDHPNIAKVLDAGTTGPEKGDGSPLPERPEGCFAQKSPVPFFSAGRPYFVMELVRGVPITQYCDEHHLTPRQRLELLVPVCQAIQHAHQKGIIHRDIKPTNILIAEYDEKPVPKVIDFGVAKAIGSPLTEKTMFTGFGQLVGTLEYMSPEQAKFNQLDIDTRSDIYPLGVLMYELLTGSTPFEQARLRTLPIDETLRIIREEEPEKPSTRLSSRHTPCAVESSRHTPHSSPHASREENGTRSVPATLASIAAVRGTEPAKLTKLLRGELDWIVMKCLEKDRNQRYESASAFAADVQRYLHDEPVQACPHSTLYQLRKVARRHKRALISLSAVALVALLAVAVLAVSTGLVWQANQELRTEVYFQRITVADRELSIDNLAATLRALEECPEDLRDWEWHYLMRLCKVEPLVIQESTAVHGVAFSPDGEQLASAGRDGDVRIWNSRTGNLEQTIKKAHTQSVVCVTFHPDGKHLATAGADQLVKVWDLTATDQPVFTEKCDAIRKIGGAYAAAYTVAFSPPDGQLLAAENGGYVNVWDWKKWKKGDRPLHRFSGYEIDSIPVAFSPDGRRLAASAGGQPNQIWDVETEDPICTLPDRSFPVSALAFSSDGGRLASAGLDRMVYVHDTTTGERLSKFIHSGNVLCVAFSRNGRLVASAGEDKTVRVWDATTGREVLGLRGHTAVCTCLAFSPDPDSSRLASASADGTIRIWDATPVRANDRQELLTFEEHNNEIRSVAFSPDGQEIASTGHGGLVKVWNAATERVRLDFPGHKSLTWSVAWQPPDGRRIASAGSDATAGSGPCVKVWDAVNGREDIELRSRRGNPYFAVAFSRDGQYLVTGKSDGSVEVWDAETGGVVHKIGKHERDIEGLVFSPDERWLASASSDGVVMIWDAKRLDQIQQAHRTFQARVPGPSLNVAFSPDGQRLAAGGKKNTVKIWDVQTGELLQTLEGEHSGEVYTLAFSPDGKWIASGGEDSAVKIWDSHSGAFVRNFRGHMGIVTSLAFSPDGRLLVSGSRDKTVKVWDMTQLETVPDR